MWWVAWRQHRHAVLIALAVALILAGLLLAFRIHVISVLHDLGCTPRNEMSCYTPANSVVFSSIENSWRMLRIVLTAAPIVLAVFVGAPIFPRESEQRTDIFALTQSIGRVRWWTAKVVVAGTPLVAALVGLGYLTGWVDNTFPSTHRPELSDGTFQVHSIMPAAYGLLALAIAVTVGILLRSIVGSLVTGLIVAGGIVVLIAFPLRSHLLPATRLVTPIAAVQPGPVAVTAYNNAMKGSWFLGSGFLLRDGQAIPFYSANGVPCQDISMTVTNGQQPTAQQTADYNKALAKCQADHGIKQYTDYVPASMLWPLRGIEAGICVLLAGLVLAFGAFRLRARAGSRS